MSPQRIGERRVDAVDFLQFAEASGDWNPIHTDPIAARRLLAGGVVAHGMSTVLWMLERHLSSGGGIPRGLSATFPRPLMPGDLAVLKRDEEEDRKQRLAVLVEGDEVSSALLDLEGGVRIEGVPRQVPAQRGESESPSFEQLKQACGLLSADGIEDRDRTAYPQVFGRLGPSVVAGLMAVSKLVGMHCPGLHSLIAAVQLRFDSTCSDNDIEWRVIRHSVLHAPLRIAFKGSCLEGHVDAFVRPAPVSQAAYASLRSCVASHEFAGQVALVIGGSRGLGELSAKLLAAGGGDVIVTHREGLEDAKRVADEITALGGRCRTTRFDVDHARHDLDHILSEVAVPTHVYYFAAPRIGRAKAKLFSPAVFRSFMQVFVEGFGQVAAALAAGTSSVKLFYPSTVYLDELPKDQGEYIAAKAAGEALCQHLNKHAGNLIVLSRRLPRLHTDQSAGLLSRGAPDPVSAVLSVVRAMNACESTKASE